MSDIDDAFDSPLGLTWALIKKHKQKKKLKAIEKSNEDARGIIHHKTGMIENYFDDQEPLGNVLISGGSKENRLRACVRCVECAHIQGYVPIVLHVNDYNLENRFLSYFGTSTIQCLNRQFPFYDPFLGMTDQEINQIIMGSTDENYPIKGMGKYYIDGITGFIRSKGIAPYLWMYITCPHMLLNDKIQEALNNGVITENTARMLISQIVQGELERGNIENYFAKLRNEAEYIIAKKNHLPYAASVRNMANTRGIMVMDIRSVTNVLLLNLIISEIEMLKNQGQKVFLCIVGVPLSNKMLVNFAKNSGNQSLLCMSDQDVYSGFLGDDNLFFSVTGRTSKVIISKHMSAVSCQKFSEMIGSYDKQEISSSYTGNTNLVGKFSYSTATSKNISIKREEILKPEEIVRLNEDEIYVLDNNYKKLVHVKVI